jgi:hypothetical protein
MPTTVDRCGRLRHGGNLRHEQNQGVTRAFRREKQSGDLLGHHGRHHAGSGDAPRRLRARRVPKAPLVLAPSPQNASIRSGSSGCWDCFGGAVRAGARRDPTAPRPDRRDGNGGISGTGGLRAINASIPWAPTIRRTRSAARALRPSIQAERVRTKGPRLAAAFAPRVTTHHRRPEAPHPGGVARRRRQS